MQWGAFSGAGVCVGVCMSNGIPEDPVQGSGLEWTACVISGNVGWVAFSEAIAYIVANCRFCYQDYF